MTISKEVRRAIGFGVLITLGAIVLAVVPVIAWLAMDPVTTRSDTLLRAILLPLLIAPICSFFILRADMRSRDLARENHRLAYLDELTGLPNRRAFFDGVREMRSRASGSGRRFFCALADVDDFKAVNDRWGHDAGDIVLRDLAETLNTHAPDECLIARLGGEEFAIAGIFSSEVEAVRAFRRLVEVVGASPVYTREGDLPVTISLGYCEGARPSEISTLLSRADKALYAAKRAGKNRALGFARPYIAIDSGAPLLTRRAG